MMSPIEQGKGGSMAAMPSSSVVRVPKAGEMVATQLRRQIVLGELKEGEILPSESILMQRFGVSRPTLREAFRILESEQIIHVRRGARGGARVLLPNSAVAGRYAGLLLQYRGTTLADVYEARTALETVAVTALAKSRTAADLHRLDEALADGENTLRTDVLNYAAHDTMFHRLLMELSGNQTMSVLLDMLFYIIDSHNQSYLRTVPREEGEPAARTAQRAHAKMVDLLRQRAGDKAAAFWRKHLSQVSAFMVRDPGETVLDVLS
jgi:DNA-binding FadR family transcriptional regulator